MQIAFTARTPGQIVTAGQVPRIADTVATIDENAAIGTSVCFLAATGDQTSLAFEEVGASAYLELVPSTGEIKVKAVLDGLGGTSQSITVRGTNIRGAGPSRVVSIPINNVAEAPVPVVAAQVIPFGRLTRTNRYTANPPGFGGRRLVRASNGVAINSITLGSRTTGSDHFETSGAYIRPKANVTLSDTQYVWTGCTATNDAGTSAPFTITINTEADVFSAADELDIHDAFNLLAASSYALSQTPKTIKLRGGNYTTTDSRWTMTARQFPAVVTVTQHDGNDPGVLVGVLNITNAKNLVLDGLHYDGRVTTYQDQTVGQIRPAGTTNGLVFRNSVADGHMRDRIEQGWPVTHAGLQGWIECNSATCSLTGNGLTIEDNLIRGYKKGLQPAFMGTSNGLLTIQRNEIIDFGVDAIAMLGDPGYFKINNNRIWKPLTVPEVVWDVIDVDIAGDPEAPGRAVFTLAGDVMYQSMVDGTFTLNFTSASSLLPMTSTGSRLIANRDYTAYVKSRSQFRLLSYEGTAITLTDEGVGVKAKRESAHVDFIQLAPSADKGLVKGEIKFNILAKIRDDGFPFNAGGAQGIFMEDINKRGVKPDQEYPDTSNFNVLVQENIIFSGSTAGLVVDDGYNSYAINNTMCFVNGDPPPVEFGDHNGGTRINNHAIGNIHGRVITSSALTTVTSNVCVQPGGGDDPGELNPNQVFNTDLTEIDIYNCDILTLLTKLAIKPGGAADILGPKAGAVGTGYVDWGTGAIMDRTSTNPSVPADWLAPMPTVAASVASPTAISISVTTDTTGGTVYWLVTTDPPTAYDAAYDTDTGNGQFRNKPEPVGIKTGLRKSGATAPAYGSFTVSAAGAQTPVVATGLTTGAAYYVYVMHQDAAGNYSPVVYAGTYAVPTAITPA